jgi:hypothetical protein
MSDSLDAKTKAFAEGRFTPTEAMQLFAELIVCGAVTELEEFGELPRILVPRTS